jgi:hypothetical protein
MHLREVIHRLVLDGGYRHPVSQISAVDLQGWNSDQPIFKKLVDLVQPEQIIEVGTWKGASAVHMTELAKKYCPGVVTLCIDTFTGSNATLWTDEALIGLLSRGEYGFPLIYYQFLYNVASRNLTDNIFPFPVTSSCAAEVLRHFSVEADLIYIDGGHREEEVTMDAHCYWPLVRQGGFMLCDDYGPGWPGVMAALDKFAISQDLEPQIDSGKWWVRKPD